MSSELSWVCLTVNARKVLTLEEGGEKGEVWRPGPIVWGQVRGGDRQGRQRRLMGTAWG